MVEEENLLTFVDMYDDVILDISASICMQVDIQDAYVSIPIVSIDYGFGNVNDDEDLLDLETPTECEDKEKVLKPIANCSSKASLCNKGHEDNNDNMCPSMSIDECSKIAKYGRHS